MERDPDGLRTLVRAAVDRVVAHQVRAEYHLRDLHLPEELEEFEQALSAVFEGLRGRFDRVVARRALRTG